MKKYLIMIVIVFVGAYFSSCEKSGAKLYDVEITVTYPEGYDAATMADIKVTVTNNLTSKLDSARTDATGVAAFKLEEGTYTVSASTATDEFAFNGILENKIVSPTILTFEINLIAVSLQGGLVFKEIYYTGSRTPDDKTYYADQFHEIYNNSDEVIYLDGLCIGVLETTSSNASPWVDGDGSLLPRLPVGFHAWMWPGTGTTYPLEPRTSIVLAQDGIDHQTDAAGNPSSPVNLGNADWETYVEAPGKDTDTPGVPNLTLMYTTSATMFDWLHSVFGAAVIIFRLPTGTDYQTFVSNPDNFSTKPGTTSSTEYFMVHKDWVIDAVEIVRVEPDKQNKRLPTELDAGKVWSSGTYVSQSIRRKVDKIIDGKVIYKDTNNSTEDFLSGLVPTPFVHPAVVDVK